MEKTKVYGVGIDLGGTFIKGGVVDADGKVLLSDKIPTECDGGAEHVAGRIAGLSLDLLKKAGVKKENVRGIGIGSPGMIDSRRGVVVYSNNLHWDHFAIGETVERQTGLPVRVENDANVAAYGEACFGAGKGLRDLVMITLGTGVGGGIILDGKIFEGNGSAGAEIGHSVILAGGEPCTCGRRGCLEAYASATALIRETKRAIAAHPESAMAKEKEVDGRTAFLYRDTDPAAREVTERYLGYIACGITNFANIFRPQAVIVGGGISGEGKRLTDELQVLVDREIYGGARGPAVEVRVAALGNGAGLLGAAALAMAEQE